MVQTVGAKMRRSEVLSMVVSVSNILDPSGRSDFMEDFDVFTFPDVVLTGPYSKSLKLTCSDDMIVGSCSVEPGSLTLLLSTKTEAT